MSRSLLILVVAGCTAPIGSRTQSIIGGSADSGDGAVVFLIADWGFGHVETCTAEVISPHVLLTAGHCVTPDPQQPSVGMASFSMTPDAVVDENSPTPPASLVTVTEVQAHPAFSLADLDNGSFGVHDIAVALLKDAAIVNPMPYNRGAMPVAGAATRLVGYGLSDAQLQMGAGTRRQTTTNLSDFDGDRLHFADGQHQACNGDSGGPALQTLGGTELIIGVTSGGDNACNSGGYYTRVDVNSPFIDSFVQMHDPGFLVTATPDLGSSPDLMPPATAAPPPDLAEAPDLAPPSVTLPTRGACSGPKDCPSGHCEIDGYGVPRCVAPAIHGGCSMTSTGPAPRLLWILVALLLWRRRPGKRASYL